MYKTKKEQRRNKISLEVLTGLPLTVRKFGIVVSWSLCASLHHQSCLEFDDFTSFIALFDEHPFVGYWNGIQWFLNQSPSPHLVELV